MEKPKTRRQMLFHSITGMLGMVLGSSKLALGQKTSKPTPTPKSTPTPKPTPVAVPESALIQYQQALSPYIKALPNSTKDETPDFTFSTEIENEVKNLEVKNSKELKSVTIDVAPGEKRFTRDDNEWEKLLNALKDIQVTKDNHLNKPLQSRFMAIDNSFEFTAETTDEEFYITQAERWLDQAADLLDRSIRDRDEWNDKAVKSLQVGLELQEYVELDMIHQAEIAAGFYTLSLKESQALLNAELTNKWGNNVAGKYIQDLLNKKFTIEEMKRQSRFAQRQAWLAHLASYEYPNGGKLLQHKYGSDDENTSPELNKNAARGLSQHYLETQRTGLLSQAEIYQNSERVSNARIAGLQSKVDWDTKDIDFRRQRTEVAKRLADLKTKAFTETGGALNYDEQMLPIKERFQRDFRDALARIYKAADGLRLIYGYNVPLPQSITKLKTKDFKKERQQSPYKYLDDSIIWVRNAISWLVRFSQSDQNYVLPVSVKRLMPKEDWDKGKGVWECEIKKDLFPGQSHVRLRGISAFVVLNPDDNAGVWQAIIRPPQQSFCEHLSGNSKDLDQCKIPPCRLGRIRTREDIRDPDITGILTLHNVSPFGKWKVEISKISTEDIPVEKIKDVHIDLHLAVRPSS